MCESARLLSMTAEAIGRRRNWMPWIGLLVILLCLFLNALFFVGVSVQKAIPSVSMVLVVVAAICAVLGIMRSFRQPQIYGGKISSSILGGITLLLCAFIALASVGARKLPDSAAAPQPGQKAPDFTLADTNGSKVSLAQLLGNAGGAANGSNSANAAAAPKAVLLIFYRGYW